MPTPLRKEAGHRPDRVFEPDRIGQWIVLFPVGLILFEVKIRMEEHLMMATFPEEYPRYRRQVPQLVPGLYALRRRHSVSL